MQDSGRQIERLTFRWLRNVDVAKVLRVGVAALLWLGARVPAQQRVNMNNVMEPLKVAASSPVTSLRLIQEGGVTELVLQSSEGDMRPVLSLANSENGALVRTLPVAEPRASKWDTTVSPDQAISFVFSIPESASIWLSYRSTKPESTTVVTRKYLKGYFGAPHFVKGENNLAITSVATIDRVTRPVLFSRMSDGGYGEFRALPSPGHGDLIDARLLHVGSNYVLFTRVLTGGDGNREAGILSYSVLDANFREVKPARVCFNGLPVLAFDVDTDGGRVTVLATTPHGYVLTAKGDGAHFDEIPVDGLSSPSILSSGGNIHIAALESAGTPKARVLVGHARTSDNSFLP